MMTPISLCLSLTCRRTSRPFIPSICTSSKRTSTEFAWSVRSASSPEPTAMGNIPALRTMASIVCRMLRSSSAMRTVAALAMGRPSILARTRVRSQTRRGFPDNYTDGEEDEEHPTRDERFEQRRLESPDEGDDCEPARDVRQPVQRLPSAETEPLDPALRRRDGKGGEAAPGGESYRHDLALDDVLPDAGKVEALIDPHVRREMDCRVEEGKQPHPPPHPQRPLPPEYQLQRCARERAQEQDQRIEPETVQYLGYRIRAEPAEHPTA